MCFVAFYIFDVHPFVLLAFLKSLISVIAKQSKSTTFFEIIAIKDCTDFKEALRALCAKPFHFMINFICASKMQKMFCIFDAHLCPLRLHLVIYDQRCTTRAQGCEARKYNSRCITLCFVLRTRRATKKGVHLL